MHKSNLPEIVCEGSPYEMGYAQGKWLKPHADGILRALIDNKYVPRWFKMAGLPTLKSLLTLKGFQVRNKHFANIWKSSPDQFERLRGIAEGSGMKLTLLLGMMAVETMLATFKYVMGCTSLGVGKERSKTRSPMIGYNHDFPDFLKQELIVRRSRPKQGHASVQLTYPTLPGSICGVNAAGLAVTLNHAFSIEPHNDGVPPTFLVQHVLDFCGTAEEAAEVFKHTKFANGSMATVADADGGLYALELARGRFGVRKPKHGISLTLNEYQIPDLKEIEVPQDAVFHPKKYPKFFEGLAIHQPNWERKRRFAKLLDEEKKLTDKDVKRLLSDHNGHRDGAVGSICRHHATSDTIATAVVYPKEGVLEVSRGFACQAKYQTFEV
ncbi:MAG TPA: C45 family peptidase [bacterium]|nr:C45 family peptidase [bacterium]